MHEFNDVAILTLKIAILEFTHYKLLSGNYKHLFLCIVTDH